MGARKNILCLIPARSGSKGLRHKNVRRLHGIPLLARAVRLARSSARAGERWTVVCSTDSRRYGAIAREAGADRVLWRPPPLASDTARLVDVVRDALGRLEAEGERYDALVMLSPTTPLTTPRDVRAAVRAFWAGDGAPVASVKPPQQDLSWRFQLTGARLRGGAGTVRRRQQAEGAVDLNGAIYVASTQWLSRHPQFVVPGKTYGLMMPKERSVDIEDTWDLMWCDVLLRSHVDLRQGRRARPAGRPKQRL